MDTPLLLLETLTVITEFLSEHLMKRLKEHSFL